MKIAIISTIVPFVFGGGRNIASWLNHALDNRGIHSEVFFLPQSEDPKKILEQTENYRKLDFSFADQIITIRPQSHAVYHERKKVWLIHQSRGFYDLWNTPFSIIANTPQHRKIRKRLVEVDTKYLSESTQIFTNSKIVQERLFRFNHIRGEVLYPPLPENYMIPTHKNEISSPPTLVYISRIEHFKRQHLILEALHFVKSNCNIVIAGQLINPGYGKYLKHLIWRWNLQKRVQLITSYISEEEKNALIESSLATVYIPFDEDSYGYPSLEASMFAKPILTTSDSGGVLEYVEHMYNGYVANPNPKSLAKWIDFIISNENLNHSIGENNASAPEKLDISWDNVVKALVL